MTEGSESMEIDQTNSLAFRKLRHGKVVSHQTPIIPSRSQPKKRKNNDIEDLASSDFSEDETILSTRIQELGKIKEPSTSQLMEAIIKSNLQSQLNFRSLGSKVNENTTRINKLTETTTWLNKKQIKSDRRLNYQEQVSYQRELVITGFDRIPDIEKLKHKLNDKLHFGIENLDKIYGLALNTKTKGKLILVNIVCKFLSVKETILTKKIEIGDLYVRDLVDDADDSEGGKMIFISNRFTPENNRIRMTLKNLEKEGKVSVKRFRNNKFQYKCNQLDDWMDALCVGDLTYLLKDKIKN